MSFDDLFRLSSHAVITDDQQRILLLRANYGERGWGLPGGALDAGETIHQALKRECQEELSCEVDIQYLSGVYYHTAFDSQAFIFRCVICVDSDIVLSDEHSEFKYCHIDDLSEVQKRRVLDCLDYSGAVVSRKF